FPAEFPDWLFADKRNALVRYDTLRLFAHESTVDALDRKRLVIIPVSYLLVLAVLRSQFLLNLAQGFAGFLC
ncbi:MAG: hypothetical protein IJJ91_00225, partial [Synergistaceae bacterium]|nr:hypothetical protein [Synergistaceae bacterium]